MSSVLLMVFSFIMIVSAVLFVSTIRKLDRQCDLLKEQNERLADAFTKAYTLWKLAEKRNE